MANIFTIDFGQFKNTVLVYLQEEERRRFDDSSFWDEICLSASRQIEELV